VHFIKASGDDESSSLPFYFSTHAFAILFLSILLMEILIQYCDQDDSNIHGHPVNDLSPSGISSNLFSPRAA
jgi:hypothetical protein